MDNRAIDAAIAEHVMGHKVITNGLGMKLMYPDKVHSLQEVPSYSTDIAAAWQVVEKLGQMDVECYTNQDGSLFYNASTGGGFNINFSEAPTAPMSICLAALKAKGVEVD